MASCVTLRLGTRGSLLARRQSTLVAAEIELHHPHIRVLLEIIKTTGDQIVDRPLHEEGGKGLFVKELEQALLAGEVDFAVHSCKDLPVTMPLVDESVLTIAAMPPRADPRDLLISPNATAIGDLPKGARVGTGSLRRECQLLALRGDLKIAPVRGNVDTRLKKLAAGEYDALILAAAGVERAGLSGGGMHPVPLEQILSAPGQGALAIQCRRDDRSTMAILKTLDDAKTHQCVTAERELVAALQADCHSPIGALAQIDGDQIYLRAAVGGRDGKPTILKATAHAPVAQYARAVAKVHDELRSQGVMALLHGHK
jgi:hydroxymethylbilane synthase